MKQGPSAAERLLESTPPLGVEDRARAGAGTKGCMASNTPPPLTKSIIPFQAGRGNISMTVLALGGMVPEYLSRTNVDRSLSHAPMSRLTTPASTSMRPRTTLYLVMRDEKPVELVGDLI